MKKIVVKPAKNQESFDILNRMELKIAIGENYFSLVNDLVFENVIFSFFQNLSFLCKEQKYGYVGGTFKNSPKHFLLSTVIKRETMFQLHFVSL